METPDGRCNEVVAMLMSEQDQPQILHIRLQQHEGHAAVDQDIIVDDYGVALGAG